MIYAACLADSTPKRPFMKEQNYFQEGGWWPSPIKIGYARDIERRLKELTQTYRCSSGRTTAFLALIGQRDGDKRVERLIHQELLQYRVKDSKEWFAYGIADALRFRDAGSDHPVVAFCRALEGVK